jgi:NitT/TauT family transport system ATP-binding protein
MHPPLPARSIEPKITISDLSVRFETSETVITALDCINLVVAENELVCVMGPSGCGKTTLLNCIAGIVAPSAGDVQVGGAPVRGPGPDRAVVFQEDAVFPWMTVEDNIGYSPRIRGRSKIEIAKTIDRYVSLVGLDDFRKAWPRQLSGGMKKRVDLARGYAADPEVLLMDEPFGALDIMTKEHLLEEFYKLWRVAPRTVIFVTHDLEEALFLGDRVILMSPRPGRIDSEYRPNFPIERDMSLKTTPEFVRFAKQLRDALQSHHATSKRARSTNDYHE